MNTRTVTKLKREKLKNMPIANSIYIHPFRHVAKQNPKPCFVYFLKKINNSNNRFCRHDEHTVYYLENKNDTLSAKC